MRTVIFYNCLTLFMIAVLAYSAIKVRKSEFSKNARLFATAVCVVLSVCAAAFLLFINAIAFGLIGLVPD